MPHQMSLQELLQHKSYIKDVARTLGFKENIRIGKYGEGQLTLVVDINNEKDISKLHYGELEGNLRKWLTYKYESLIYILTKNPNLDSLLQGIVNESVSIDDEQGLSRLFNKNLDDIKFSKDYIEDEDDLAYTIPELQRLLESKSQSKDQRPKKSF